jgi:hypothetical protein
MSPVGIRCSEWRFACGNPGALEHARIIPGVHRGRKSHPFGMDLLRGSRLAYGRSANAIFLAWTNQHARR